MVNSQGDHNNTYMKKTSSETVLIVGTKCLGVKSARVGRLKPRTRKPPKHLILLNKFNNLVDSLPLFGQKIIPVRTGNLNAHGTGLRVRVNAQGSLPFPLVNFATI